MLSRLDPSVIGKLSKIAGLFGSDHDGERSAAAWQATRLLQAHGLTWADVFAPPPTVRLPVRAPHVAGVQWALQFQDRLTDRECKFLVDIGRCRRISAKQTAWLGDILRKLRQSSAG
jgi:hypothetical protein